MFSCIWGLSIHIDALGHLNLLSKDQSLNSRCKFVVKMVYLSNIFKIVGIISLHEE